MNLRTFAAGSGLKPSYPRHDEIIAALSIRKPPSRVGDAIVMSTDVLLPSNVTCVVVIEGGAAGHEITASDAGAALACVREAGLEVNGSVERAAARAAQSYGLSMERGILRSQPESISEARYLVLCMANAMSHVANAALAAAKKHEKVRFRERVQSELTSIFAENRVHRNGVLRGFSQDTHKFDFVVGFEHGRKLALDVPIPDPTSIAAVVLRQADMRAALDENIRQAIAYDKGDKWTSSSLAQLQLAKVPLVTAGNLRAGLIELSQ
jgi:hypothetical protein